MSYVKMRTTINDVKLKKDGKLVIQLETTDDLSGADLRSLRNMIGQRNQTEFDSEVVTYNVQINARNNKPIKSYKVDDSGVVSEVKEKDGQLSLDDVGVKTPAEKVEVIEEPAEIDKEVVDAFILENLAPRFDDIKLDVHDIMVRRSNGDSFISIARELKISSGEFLDILNEYRRRVAPMAKAWDEWRKNESPAASKQETSPDEQNAVSETSSENAGDVSEKEAGEETTAEETTSEPESLDPFEPEDIDVAEEAPLLEEDTKPEDDF